MTTTDLAETTAVLLIAHGSRRAEANDDARALAGRIAARGEYRIVRAAFLELAQPDIPTGAAGCVAAGVQRVLMIPYFLAEGVHLRRDLAAARDELAGRFPEVGFVLGPPLGPHPLLDRLVVERIRQTAGSTS
jgi:sirohydrochlorin ferrochelatase